MKDDDEWMTTTFGIENDKKSFFVMVVSIGVVVHQGGDSILIISCQHSRDVTFLITFVHIDAEIYIFVHYIVVGYSIIRFNNISFLSCLLLLKQIMKINNFLSTVLPYIVL